MKLFKTLLSVMLVAAVLMSMTVISVGAYNYTDKSGTFDVTLGTAGTTYVYDFKNADGSLMDKGPIVGHNSAAVAGQCAITEDGLTMYTNGFGLNQDSWINEFALADSDFKVGDKASLTVMAGFVYEISVTWMRTDASESAKKFIGLGYASESGNALNGKTKVFAQGPNQSKANTYRTDTITVDCDKLPNGKLLCVLTNTGLTYVKQVAVKIYDKNAKFTPKEDSVSVDFTKGYRDLYMPTSETESSDKSYTGGEVTIENDPLNTGRGKVYCATTHVENNVAISVPNVAGNGIYRNKNEAFGTPEGFKMTNGVKYRIKFDIYVESNVASDVDGIRNIEYYNCDVNHIAYNGGTKNQITGASFGNADVANGWVTITKDVTANTANGAAPYFMLMMAVYSKTGTGADYSAKIYIDNFSITALDDRPTEDAAGYVRSIRAENASSDYVSAGVRFRAELPKTVADAASEIGFVVAPEVKTEGAWYDLTSGAPALSSAKKVVVGDKIYGTNGDNNQYQLIITNLTKQGETKNLKDTYFDVVLYVKDAEGNYTYYNVGTSSYNEVKNSYVAKDAMNSVKY